MTAARAVVTAVAAAFLLLVLQVPGADAFFRHACRGEVGIGRVDSIMSPGKPSQHLHGIHGASSKSDAPRDSPEADS
jgi:hypothetical protein